jgi:tetratricopeptide (TPR) repeat protein
MTISPSRPPCGRPYPVDDADTLPPTSAARRPPLRVATALALLLLFAPGVAPAEPEPAASGVPPLAAAPPSEAPAGEAEPTVPGTARAIAPALTPPVDLGDLDAWLQYRRAAHLAALPDESRLFYRRGLIAERAGQNQEAIRLVRGAGELDPWFVTPHLTLASWFLARDPSQSLLHYAAALDLLRRSFLLQIQLVANLAFSMLQGLFVGLLVTSLLIVFLRQAELRHMWEERLRRPLCPMSARIWAWALLIVPFIAGVGLAIPIVVFMGLLWPLLRGRERVVFVALLVALVAAPFSGHLTGRLAAPLREDHGPLFGIAGLQDEAWTPARQASLEHLATEHPDDPFVLFGLGWYARRGGDLATAERSYRRALELWPNDPRVLNNLANVNVAQGRMDPAIDLYRRAVAADPEDAAAYFNLSQAETRQYDYHAASEAAARASALDFELVKTQQALGTDDGRLPLADQWIAPVRFWKTVIDREAVAHSEPALPLAWRGHVETSGLPFAATVLVLGLGSLVMGLRWQRGMALRPCRNCARVVCRRCAQRRRELALCPACAEHESRAESPEFARVLLARQRGRMERSRRLVRTTLAALLPGYGLLAFHCVFRAATLIILTAMLAAPWVGVSAPFAYQRGPGPTDATASAILTLGALMVVYAASLLGYVSKAARVAAQTASLAEPVRSRPSQVTQITAKAA